MGDTFSKRLLNVLLGQSNPALTIYPVQNYAAGAGALVPGATMTVAAGAWPAYVDIIGAGAILAEFWLVQLQFDTCTLAATIDQQIYNATTARTVWEEKLHLTATTVNLGPITFPFPIWCIASSRIQGRIGGTAGKTINVSLLVATGL